MSATAQTTSRELRWCPIVIGLSALVAFAPGLFEFGQRLWRADHYSFFPLYVAAIGAIAYRRWSEHGSFNPSFNAASAARWVLPLALLAASVWLRRPWLAGVGFLFGLRAFIYVWGGESLFRAVRVAWWMLWMLVPPPFNLDLELIVRLQRFASSMSSSILDWLGYRHLLTGVLLNFPGHTFEIEEACSGVHSLYASLAGVAIYCALLRRGPLRTGMLLLLAVFWVLVMNVARILMLVIGEMDYRISLGDGLAHELAGYAIFVLVVLAVISSDRFLVFVLPARTSFGHKPDRRITLLSRLQNRKLPPRTVGVAIATAFSVLFGWYLVRPATANPSLRVSGTRLALTEDTLADEIVGWRRTSFEVTERRPGDINGEVSYIWTYDRAGLECTVAVDGPFGLWHDLGYCYAARGWQLSSSNDLKMDILGEDIVASQLTMEDDAGQYGHVVFAVFAADGSSIAPPAIRLGATSGPRLQHGVTSLLTPRVPESQGPAFCVQLFASEPLGFSEQERAQHRELLRNAVLQLRQELSRTVGKPEGTP